MLHGSKFHFHVRSVVLRCHLLADKLAHYTTNTLANRITDHLGPNKLHADVRSPNEGADHITGHLGTNKLRADVCNPNEGAGHLGTDRVAEGRLTFDRAGHLGPDCVAVVRGRRHVERNAVPSRRPYRPVL